MGRQQKGCGVARVFERPQGSSWSPSEAQHRQISMRMHREEKEKISEMQTRKSGELFLPTMLRGAHTKGLGGFLGSGSRACVNESDIGGDEGMRISAGVQQRGIACMLRSDSIGNTSLCYERG